MPKDVKDTIIENLKAKLVAERNKRAVQHKAVHDYLAATKQDLCHDLRQELAAAFDLDPGEPTPGNVIEFCRGCHDYHRQIFGHSPVGDLLTRMLQLSGPQPDGGALIVLNASDFKLLKELLNVEPTTGPAGDGGGVIRSSHAARDPGGDVRMLPPRDLQSRSDGKAVDRESPDGDQSDDGRQVDRSSEHDPEL